MGYFVLPALQQCIAIEATCANDKACHFQTTGLKLNRPLCVQSNKLLALFWLGRSFKIQVQTAGPGDVRRVSNHLIILGALVEVCHEGPKVFLGLLVKKKVHTRVDCLKELHNLPFADGCWCIGCLGLEGRGCVFLFLGRVCSGFAVTFIAVATIGVAGVFLLGGTHLDIVE